MKDITARRVIIPATRGDRVVVAEISGAGSTDARIAGFRAR